MVRFFQDGGAAIVCDPDRQGAAFLAFAQARQGERRLAAGGHGNDHVIGMNIVLAHELHRMLGLVLGAFDRFEQRFLAARHEKKQPLRRPVERWNQLGAILDRQPPGGAGAGINEPTAVPQPRFDGAAARSMAGRMARTAATAANWPSMIASRISEGSQTSIPE